MAVLDKLRRRHAPSGPLFAGATGDAITAAAVRVNMSNRGEARRVRDLRQGWQTDAWAFYHSIGELRYGVEYQANCSARMRLFPAVFVEDGETNAPVPIDKAPDVPDLVIQLAKQALRDLGDGRMDLSGLQHDLSTNRTVSGECWLMGRKDPDTGEESWQIRSVSEVVVFDDKYFLREVPSDPSGRLGWVELDPLETVMSRIWTINTQYRILAHSPIRAMLDDLESLAILRRQIRAVGRSRLAGRGLLLMPEDLMIKTPNNDNTDPASDSFMGLFTEALVSPIADEGVASAAVPILVRGKGESLAQVRRVDLASEMDKMAGETRAELIGVIATGLDLPKEVLEGLVDLNHWSAWQVDDNTFRHHTEPHVMGNCDALTRAFMKPYLEALLPPELMPWAKKVLIWYDPTELVTHPDQTEDALQLHDRLAISDEAMRRTAGFAESDAPKPAEYTARLIAKQRTWPANLTMGVIHEIDPALTVPPITTTGTVPGIKPTGVDLGEPPPQLAVPAGPPAPPSGGAPGPASDASKPPAAQPGPPAADRPTGNGMTASAAPPPPNLRASTDPARACGVCLMLAGGKCWGYGNFPTEETWVCDSFEQDTVAPPAPETPVAPAAPAVTASARQPNSHLSRKLSAIDADLRARLVTAANAAMARRLERAGARLATKIRNKPTLKAAIAETSHPLLAAVVGREALRAAGINDDDLLSAGDWGTLEQQFRSWTGAGQEQALRTACQLAGIGTQSNEAKAAAAVAAKSVDDAWSSFSHALDQLAKHLLYSPDPNIEPGNLVALNPDTLVPAGTVRAALAIAGGGPRGDLGISPSGVPTINLGAPIGQVGTGTTVSNLLTSAGCQIEEYQWNHGPSINPFEGHLELDGLTFTSFDDPQLANPGDWPANQYFIAGDHDGCVCDVIPMWVNTTDQEA